MQRGLVSLGLLLLSVQASFAAFVHDHPARIVKAEKAEAHHGRIIISSTRVQNDDPIQFGAQAYDFISSFSPYPSFETAAFFDWQRPHLIPEGDESFGYVIGEVVEFSLDNPEDEPIFDEDTCTVIRSVTFKDSWSHTQYQNRYAAADKEQSWMTTYSGNSLQSDGESDESDEGPSEEIEVLFTVAAHSHDDEVALTPNSMRIETTIKTWKGFGVSKSSPESYLALKLYIYHRITADAISDIVPESSYTDPFQRYRVRIGHLPYEGFLSWETYSYFKSPNSKVDRDMLRANKVQVSKIKDANKAERPPLDSPDFLAYHDPGVKTAYFTVAGPDKWEGSDIEGVSWVTYVGFVEKKFHFTYTDEGHPLLFIFSIGGGLVVAAGCMYACYARGLLAGIKLPEYATVPVSQGVGDKTVLRAKGVKSYTNATHDDDQELGEGSALTSGSGSRGGPRKAASPPPPMDDDDDLMDDL